MSGGGGGTQTVQQKSDPWVGIQPYVKEIAGQTAALPDREYYPGSTVTPYSGQTNAYISGLTDLGLYGSNVGNSASNLITDTMNGDYLNSNPYLDQMFDRAAGAVRNQTDAAFSRAGRFGSGAHQEILQEGMNDLATQIYGQNYQNERNAQQQALALAPGIDNQNLTNLQQLYVAGGLDEAKMNEYLQDQISRWDYYQNQPWQTLSDKSGIINGVAGQYGQSTSTSTTPQPSKVLGALGGAATGAAIGSVVPGVGTAIGAVAGALFGAFA